MSARDGTLLERFGHLADEHPELAARIAHFDREHARVHRVTLQKVEDVCDAADAGIMMLIGLIVILSAVAAAIAINITH